MGDRFDFGVPFEQMTPVQRRVHNRRATARNRGLPVSSTDELCALELDHPDWNLVHHPAGRPGPAALPPGSLSALRIRPRHLRGHRLTAPGIPEMRRLLSAQG